MSNSDDNSSSNGVTQSMQSAEIAITAEIPDVVQPERKRRGFQKGFDPKRNLGGSRPRRFREIQRMLNQEHRTIENMRPVFERLRALALGETIIIPVVTSTGELKMTCKLDADAAYMKLYLERVLGPARELDDEVDFSDAPAEFFEYLRRKMVGGG